MHSIERYGIVALLFLVVTVVAVLMWDGSKNKKKGRSEQAAAAAPSADGASQAGAMLPDGGASRRLSLEAEAKPGPLFRATPESQTGSSAPLSSIEDPAASTGAQPLTAEPASGDASASGTHPAASAEPPREEPVVDRPFASTAAPASGPTHAYLVRPNDTLSEIAQRELGSARRWAEIVAVNPGLDPGRLRAGKTIQVPGAGKAAAALEAAKPGAPAGAPARTWKVGQGENLWKIAERTLGSGARWKEIAALNPGLDPDRLVLGQVIKVPGQGAASTAKGTATPAAAPKGTLVASNASADRPRRGGKVK